MSAKLPKKPIKAEQTQILSPLLRLPQVLLLVPVSKSTWWQWVADGKAPSPVKIGPKCTAWRTSDIQSFIDSLSIAGK